MTTTPPVPPDTDAAAFVAALRRLKVWSGLSYRQLERRAAQAGHVLPHSTVATMLGRDRLPREELVAVFVAACGVRGEAAQAWLDARVSIAYGQPAEVVPTPALIPTPTLIPAPRLIAAPTLVPTSTSTPTSTPRSRRARRPRWALAGAAVALATALLAGVAGTGVLTDDVDVVETQTSLPVLRS
ncbi:hypothetical protein ACIQAC_31720 [Streptomyces sp. NPDC088387]|uniref:hypothetical protein n=1 Tax=Streptomyces sp. NPDC088387 TaxID=3365859 RepID=UPI00381C65DB